MEKGIFTKDQEKKLGELLDEVIKLKGVLEVADGFVFKAIITLVDDNLIEKLPDELKAKLSELATAVLAEDVELAEKLASDIINGLLDIPGLDEESEGLIIGGLIKLIVGAILNWIQKKKEAPVKLKLFY